MIHTFTPANQSGRVSAGGGMYETYTGRMEGNNKRIQKSGLSQRKWCKIHGEDRNRLQYWLLRFEYLSLGTDVSFAQIVPGGECNGTETSK